MPRHRPAEALAHDQQRGPRRRRAEREAHADLARALRHDEAEQRVDARHRHEQRDGAARGEQRAAETPLPRFRLRQLAQRVHLGKRQIRARCGRARRGARRRRRADRRRCARATPAAGSARRAAPAARSSASRRPPSGRTAACSTRRRRPRGTAGRLPPRMRHLPTGSCPGHSFSPSACSTMITGGAPARSDVEERAAAQNASADGGEVFRRDRVVGRIRAVAHRATRRCPAARSAWTTTDGTAPTAPR